MTNVLAATLAIVFGLFALLSLFLGAYMHDYHGFDRDLVFLAPCAFLGLMLLFIILGFDRRDYR